MDIFEFHDKLITKADEFLANNKTSADSEKIIIFAMLNYLIKSYKLIKGINLLCKADLEGNAKILLRTLFEAFCLSAYVADAPNDIARAEDCVIRAFIAEKKQIEHLRNLKFFDIQTINDNDIKERVLDKSNKIEQKDKIIISNYEESINRLKKRQEYSGLSDKDIQNKFEKEINNKIFALLNKKYGSEEGVKKNLIYKYYATAIRDSSASVHCNDLWDHVNKNENGEWEIFKNDRVRYTDLILRMSANLFIQIMHNTNETLKLGKDILIQELDKEYGKIINGETSGKQ